MQQFPVRDTSEQTRTHLDSDSLFNRVMDALRRELESEAPAVTEAVVKMSEQQLRHADLGSRFGRRMNVLEETVNHGVDGNTHELAQQAEIDFGLKNLDQSMQVASSFDDKADQMAEAYKALGAAYSTTVSNPLQELTS